MPYDLMDKEISKLKLETNPSYYDGYTKAIVAKQNDINSRLLCVDIFASGERVDISKYSTKMNVKMPNNKHLATNGQLIDGNLYFRIYDSMLAQIGHISCDVSLYKECINVVADTDGSINYTDVTVEQDTFINKVGDLGSYIFEYDGNVWMLGDAVATLSDYGITLNENAELFSGDKIIVSYSNYMLLTTETFFIVVQEKNHSEDADIPVDSDGKVFEYINADDVLLAVEQMHTHTNKDILDNTTAIYTAEDKTKLANINTSLYIEKSVMGKANGVATLDNSGLVPSAQLPSFVDDTIEGYTTTATALSEGWLSLTDGGNALTPEKGKIYIVVSDGEYKNKQYRWGGTTYVLCNPSDVNSVNGKTGIVELVLDDIPNGTNFVHTTNDFSNAYKTKLEGIEEGAQVNVNSDWNATDGEAGFIKNKPIIPDGAKLYAGTGDNTDGSIHQKGVTDLLSAITTSIDNVKNNYLPLSGGAMSGDIIGTAFKGVVRGNDTRDDDFTADYYFSLLGAAGEINEFKDVDAIGAPNGNSRGWVYLKTMNTWVDPSGGYPFQLAMGNGLAYRKATAGTTWGDWKTVLDSSNIETYAASPSHTHSYLPLSGGTLTGAVQIKKGSNWGQLQAYSASNYYRAFEADDDVVRIDVRNTTTTSDRRYINIFSGSAKTSNDDAIQIVRNSTADGTTSDYVATRNWVKNNTLSSGDNSQFVLGGTIRKTTAKFSGGSTTYFNICTWNINTYGNKLIGKLSGSAGYNASDGQNFMIDFIVNTSNGTANGTYGHFEMLACIVNDKGRISADDVKFYIQQVSSYKMMLYCSLPAYCTAVIDLQCRDYDTLTINNASGESMSNLTTDTSYITYTPFKVVHSKGGIVDSDASLTIKGTLYIE